MSMMLASTPLPPLQPTRQALRACPIAPLQGARYAAVLRWVAMEAVDGGGETARGGEKASGGTRRGGGAIRVDFLHEPLAALMAWRRAPSR